MVINSHGNYFKAVFMIQTKIGAQYDYNHLTQVHLYIHLREPLKNLQGTKDHITSIFDPFMQNGNKRAYIHT